MTSWVVVVFFPSDVVSGAGAGGSVTGDSEVVSLPAWEVVSGGCVVLSTGTVVSGEVVEV